MKQHSWLGYYIFPPPSGGGGGGAQGPGGSAAQQTIELRLSRFVGDGFHEDVDLTNFTQQPVQFTLELEIDADFADQKETKQGQRQQQGEITRQWRQAEAGGWELAFDYRVEHAYDEQGEKGIARLRRGCTLRIENFSSPPSYQDGRLAFRVELPPHGTWHTCLNAIPLIDGKTLKPLYGCRSFPGTQNEFDLKREDFLREATGFSTPESNTLSSVVVGALEQARYDLAALRLYDLDQGERAWIMAAGPPVYIALFGRDTLTTAWQAALAGPDMMHGVLAELPRWQGTAVNDWRDEQPGKMLHQADTGPLAMLNLQPLGRYYGSVTTSAFYPVVVAELWHWTGNKDWIAPLIDPALKALKWLDEYAHLKGDTFYWYQMRSQQGVKNQAWKDSGDAIVHADGSQVPDPIATCEEQGFVYLAKLHMAEVLWWFDRKEEAKRLYNEASELKKRFNQAFWIEDLGFFALGLDPQQRQIKSIASNPGHCIATAIVDEARVKPTVGRLLADDMFSGWGIRTLSSEHPAYDPYSYHRGTVWPVEQATFTLGFYRYGLHQHVEQLCRAQFEAIALFDLFRPPECFTGHSRDADHLFPSVYPQANWPQAWSASAIFCFLQAMLGLYPYAPLNMLLVDPHLPEWLPEITLSNLHVGNAVATIRFYRQENGASGYQVLDKRGSLHVLRQPSPWSLTASYAERLKDALASLLPGK